MFTEVEKTVLEIILNLPKITIEEIAEITEISLKDIESAYKRFSLVQKTLVFLENRKNNTLLEIDSATENEYAELAYMIVAYDDLLRNVKNTYIRENNELSWILNMPKRRKEFKDIPEKVSLLLNIQKKREKLTEREEKSYSKSLRGIFERMPGISLKHASKLSKTPISEVSQWFSYFRREKENTEKAIAIYREGIDRDIKLAKKEKTKKYPNVFPILQRISGYLRHIEILEDPDIMTVKATEDLIKIPENGTILKNVPKSVARTFGISEEIRLASFDSGVNTDPESEYEKRVRLVDNFPGYSNEYLKKYGIKKYSRIYPKF